MELEETKGLKNMFLTSSESLSKRGSLIQDRSELQSKIKEITNISLKGNISETEGFALIGWPGLDRGGGAEVEGDDLAVVRPGLGV